MVGSFGLVNIRHERNAYDLTNSRVGACSPYRILVAEFWKLGGDSISSLETPL
jgi:hypothetical protein